MAVSLLQDTPPVTEAPDAGDAGLAASFVDQHQGTDDFFKLSSVVNEKAEALDTAAPPSGEPDKEPLNWDAGQSMWQRMKAKAKGGNKFRTLARMIKTNLAWAKELQVKVTDEVTDDKFVVNMKSGAETLTFDVNHFKVKDRSYGGLSGTARRILVKHPLERSEEELLLLKDVVDRLKCFAKYPGKIKHDMTRIIFYESFADGRVIIQQGHVGQSFYFIVSGAVDVSIMDTDRRTGSRHVQKLGVLAEGSSFGELALMHNIRRTATIICKGNSEFLRVDKHDFESVLRTSYEREWDDRLTALSWISAFKSCTRAELVACNNMCKMKEYPKDTIVHQEVSKTPDYIQFVVQGECSIVRKVMLVKEQKEFGESVYHLSSDRQIPQTARRSSLNQVSFIPEVHFWKIGMMSKGFYYGIGEKMKDTYIISNVKLEVMLVPRVFFSKGKARLLEKMREDLDTALPSNSHLFRIYFDECQWHKYKRTVTEGISKRRSLTNTAVLADVPQTIANNQLYKISGVACTNPECCGAK